jgi:hypothetical protein
VRDNDDDDEKIFIYELSICIYLMVDFGLAHFVILLERLRLYEKELLQ